jgi:hypothetical protein
LKWVNACDRLAHVRFGSKSGKAQNEQMFSGLPPEADLRSARLKEYMP